MKRILIISYFFPPFKGVGTFRPYYWAKNIKNFDNSYECDVITATPDPVKEKTYNIYYIKDSKHYSFFSLFIKDPGLSWKKDLLNYFKSKNIPHYDIIIITGGPFLHFGIGSFLKKKYGCKIILDFRDPFANNPKFKDNIIKKIIKRILEYSFIKDSDIVITVNKECAKLITCKDLKKIKIIENGYDESIVEKILLKRPKKKSSSSITKIIYAGKLYNDVNPEPFFNVITEKSFINNFIFYYIGPNDSLLQRWNKSKNIYLFEQMDYKKVLEFIVKCDVGLILTGGKPFESTTKIFDYIGLGKKILIITEGKIKTGSLNYITKNLKNVVWAQNSYFKIKEALNKIQNMNITKKPSNIDLYSRRNGLKKLLHIINNL